MKRVLVTEPLVNEAIELLQQRIQVDIREGLKPAELAQIIPDYDGLIVRSNTQVDAPLIAAGTRLQVIGRAGIGVDNIDL